ncbi:MAG: hypothetical protein ACXV3F_07535 [Frankiaceae bacterium]
MSEPIEPRRLITDPRGHAMPREVADAYLLSIDLAELAAQGRIDLLRAMVPTHVADFRLLSEAQATFNADFTIALAGVRDLEVLTGLFDRLRLRVLTVADLMS